MGDAVRDYRQVFSNIVPSKSKSVINLLPKENKQHDGTNDQKLFMSVLLLFQAKKVSCSSVVLPVPLRRLLQECNEKGHLLHSLSDRFGSYVCIA